MILNHTKEQERLSSGILLRFLFLFAETMPDHIAVEPCKSFKHAVVCRSCLGGLKRENVHSVSLYELQESRFVITAPQIAAIRDLFRKQPQNHITHGISVFVAIQIYGTDNGFHCVCQEGHSIPVAALPLTKQKILTEGDTFCRVRQCRFTDQMLSIL